MKGNIYDLFKMHISLSLLGLIGNQIKQSIFIIIIDGYVKKKRNNKWNPRIYHCSNNCNHLLSVDTDFSNTISHLSLFSFVILSCYSVETCRGVIELKIFCEFFLKEDITTSFESHHFSLDNLMIILLKYTVVVFFLLLQEIQQL